MQHLTPPWSSHEQGPRPRSNEAAPVVLEFLSPSAALAGIMVPRSSRLNIWLVASLMAASVAVTGLIEIDRVVTATGRVVANAPTIVVQPLETAVVRSINVHEGQRVRAGDLLARFDPTFAEADVGGLEVEVAALDAEVARLDAEVTGQAFTPAGLDAATALQETIYARHVAERGLKLESYRQKLEGLRASSARASEAAETFQERLGLARGIEGMRRTLAEREVGSRLNWLVATDGRLEIQRDLSAATATLETARTDLAALLAERDAYATNWVGQAAVTLSEQARKLSDAREALVKARRRRAMVDLRADRDATVLTIAKVSEGSVLQSGERLVTLVPAGVALEVEAAIPGGDSGFVRVGDPVAIKFDTFPFTQYGLASGRVRSVSADSFTPADQYDARGASEAPADGRPFYRARISIDRVDLSHVPPDFAVSPGMPVTADVEIGRHTLLASLMSRLLTVGAEAMREP